MSRISIDVTDEEHRKLKALAALQGQTIKEFVLARTIGEAELAPAIAELERLLDRRLARADKVRDESVAEIFEGVRKSTKRRRDA